MNVPLFRNFNTLQARFLIALIIVGIVPSALVGLIVVNLESQALTDQSTRELTGLAQSFANELNVFLDEALIDAEAIAGLPDIVSMDIARQEPLLLKLHGHYGRHAQLAIADLSGQLLTAAVSPPVPIEQVSIARIESFQTAANEGQQDWWIGPALFNDILILHMHTPIRDNNQQVIGVLGSPVSLPHLSEVLEDISLSSNGQAFVLDEFGLVLLHPDPTEIENRRSYVTWISSPDGGLPDHEGTATYTIEGETRIAGYVPIPELGWTIVVDRPEAEVLAPAIASRNLAIGGLMVTAILSALAAIFLARGLTRPVRELSVAAQALGAGDSDAPLPENVAQNNELGTLVTAFATMRKAIIEREAALQTAHDQLERRVEERTSQLATVNMNLTQEISERKQAEKTLALARDQALEANRFKDQLLAKVSHELRTPLNAILGYTSMLGEDDFGALPAERNKALTRIMVNVDKLMDHIDNLLDQAQIQANKERKLRISAFDPAQIIDHTRSVLAPQAQAKGLALTDYIADNVSAPLFGDIQYLQDILINLVSNAIKFTEQGTIHIHIFQPEANRWALEVSDTGPGIPAEAQAYIFEPFEQIDGSITREHGGIGLGLAIVKQLIALMDGQLVLDSNMGQGSTFTILIPLPQISENQNERVPFS